MRKKLHVSRTPCSPFEVKDGRRQCCSASVLMKGFATNNVISCHVRNGICVTLRNSFVSITSRIQFEGEKTFKAPRKSSNMKFKYSRRNENIRKSQRLQTKFRF